MSTTFQFKRGLAAGIPTLADGEPGWTTDTNLLFVGEGGVNHPVNTAGGVAGGDLTGTYPNPTLGTSGVTAATYGNTTTSYPIITVDAKGRITSASSQAWPTFNQNTTGSAASCTGNAATATALATGRTISITGDLTYTSGSFNGSANVTGTGTLASTGVTPGSYTNANITVDSKGRVTAASNGSGGGGGGLTIGDAISGSSGFSVLFVDGSNKLADDATLTWNGSALAAPAITVSGSTQTSDLTVTTSGQLNDGVNLALGTSTGSQIGASAGQKLAFWGATPVVQPGASGATGYSDAGANTVHDQGTFTGGVGSTAYTIGDLVAALKTAGLIAA